MSAQGHNRTRPAPAQDAHHPGSSNAGPDLQAQAAQVLSDESGRALFLVAEVRVSMDVPPPCNRLCVLRLRLARDFVLDAGRLSREGGRAGPSEGEGDQEAV